MLKESKNYTKPPSSIITLSLQQLVDMHKDFKDLLLFISVLDPQDIPRALLDSYKDNAVVDRFLNALKKHSWVTINSSPSFPTLSIDHSTQTISLNYLVKEINFEENPQFFQRMACAVEKFIADAIEKRKIRHIKILMNHANTLLKHEIIPINSKRNLYFELGRVHFYLINNKEAKEIFETIIKDLNTSKTIEDQSLLFKALMYLGVVNREIGNYQEAKNLLEDALTFYRKYTLKDLNKFSLALLLLGIVNRELGNYKKAKDLMIESLTIYRKHFSEDWVSTAQALTYLGSVDNELANYESAKFFLEEGLNICKKFLPKNYFVTSKILSHLGNSHLNLKNFNKAKELLEESYRIDKRLYDDNKAGKSWIFIRLAQIEAEFSNDEKAKTLLDESYTCFKEFYGSEHIQVAQVLVELGKLYLKMNNIEEAENYISKALKIFEQYKHSNHYIVLEVLADLHLKKHASSIDKGDTADKIQAIFCLEQALQVVTTNFPKDSPHTARIQSKLNLISLRGEKEIKLRGVTKYSSPPRSQG